MSTREIIALIVVVSIAACTKLEVDCQYTIASRAINADGETESLTNDIVAYAFNADTAVWGVSSYSDALSGVITQRSGTQTKNYDMKEYTNQEGNFVFGFTGKPQMIVVCSTTSEVYAYRGANVAENLDKMTVPVTIDTRLSDTTYFSEGWYYIYGSVNRPEVNPSEPTSLPE